MNNGDGRRFGIGTWRVKRRIFFSFQVNFQHVSAGADKILLNHLLFYLYEAPSTRWSSRNQYWFHSYFNFIQIGNRNTLATNLPIHLVLLNIHILEKPVNLLTHWCWSLVDLNDSGMPSRNFNFLLNIPLGRHILVYLEWFNSNWSGRIFCIWCHTITNTPSQTPLHNLKFLIDSINNKMPMKMTFNRVGGSLRSPPFHLNVGYRVTLLGCRDTTNINTLAAKNSTLAKNGLLKPCYNNHWIAS